jgi:hypothetical protein
MIELGAGSSVSQTYEESQVQGSFKVASHGPSGEEVSHPISYELEI